MTQGLPRKYQAKARIYLTVTPLVIILFVLIGVLTLSIFVRSGMQLTEKNIEQVRIIMNIKQNTTSFHLWLEEYVQGDQTLNSKLVLSELALAREQTTALLESGNIQGTNIEAIYRQKIRTLIESIQLSLDDLYKIGSIRLGLSANNNPGSSIDQHFDAIYESVINYSDQAETVLREKIAEELHDYRMLAIEVAVLFIFLSFVFTYLLLRYEKRRLKDMHYIHGNEERTRTILDTIAEGIIHYDENGKIESTNPAASTLLGYYRDELNGKYIHTLLTPFPYNPNGDKQTFGKTTIVDGIKKDGSRFIAEVTINEMLLNNRMHFILSFSDITERRHIEAELEDHRKNLEEQVVIRTQELALAKDQAEKSNKAKSTFLSSMSHELRTPLNAIMGFGQLLTMKVVNTPFTNEEKESVQHIMDASQHLLEIINEVLDLSRIEAGHLDLNLEAIDLYNTLKKCTTIILPLANSNSITLNSAIDNSRGYKIHADSRRFKQVILNLLSNAIKYNQHNGEVLLSCQLLPGNCVRILVEDNGLGIDTTHQDLIFKPFIRAITTGNVPGTGIGLVISKNLIEAMGGVIAFSSTLGKGSRFWIDMPLVDNE